MLKKIILFIVVLIVLAFLIWKYGLDCHTKCQFLSELKREECRESQEDCFGIFVKSEIVPKDVVASGENDSILKILE
jgi:hypothetical protein